MDLQRAPHNREHPYTVVDNQVILNKDMSTNARMILITLLLNRDDWQPYKAELASRIGIGEKPFDKALKELKEFGYVNIKRNRGNVGRYSYNWKVREVSDLAPVFESPSAVSEPLPSHSEQENLLSQAFRLDLKLFIDYSPLYEFIDEQSRKALLKLANRLYKAIDESGSSYEDTEKETSRMMKIALIRAVHKQPNPIGYVVSTIDSWIKNGLLTTDDLEKDQQDRTGKTMADVLGLHDSGDDYILDLDNFDWNML